MKAMILAAGRGKRMQPLTDTMPKPMLSVGGKPLIVWQIQKLAAAGITDLVINLAWLGNKIRASLGDGSQFGVNITWSDEVELGLETAGGIAKALPMLGSDPFLVINADIWTDWQPTGLAEQVATMQSRNLQAWLTLVSNPPHNPRGDFTLSSDDLLCKADPSDKTYTFSGIGLYQPKLFSGVAPNQKTPLIEVLNPAIDNGLVGAELYKGQWYDIGTPERLQHLDAQLNDCRTT